MQSFGTNEFFGIDLLIGLKLISAQGGGGGGGGGRGGATLCSQKAATGEIRFAKRPSAKARKSTQ